MPEKRSLAGCVSWGACVRAAANLAIAAAIVAATYVLRKGYVVEPAKKGFFCGDQSLRYPLKEEAVSTNLIIVLGTFTVLTLAAVAEYFDERAKDRLPCCCVFPVPNWIYQTLRTFGLFLLGFSVMVMLVELGKITTGILRPNFVDACKPSVDCAEEDPLKYQSEYECTAENEDIEDLELDLRKSFPSGHAAVVSYMAAFVCAFLRHKPLVFATVSLARPLVQLVALALAWVTSLTRVSDHVHHVSDVVVGIALGAGVAFWTLGLIAEGEERRRTLASRDALSSADPEQAPLEMSNKSTSSCNGSAGGVIGHGGDRNKVIENNHGRKGRA